MSPPADWALVTGAGAGVEAGAGIEAASTQVLAAPGLGVVLVGRPPLDD